MNISFSGQFRAGKDYIAEQTGHTILRFSDPLYEFAEYFFCTREKSVPGMRKFLQLAGQFGRRRIEEGDYDLTTMRAAFVHMIRKDGADIVTNPQYRDVDWQQYGRREDFWIYVLQQRMAHIRGASIAITGARFLEEVTGLQKLGFTHYHVMCSDETRIERICETDPTAIHRMNDVSEKMAQLFDQIALNGDGNAPPEIMDDLISGAGVIWSDHRPSPRGAFWSVEQFVNTFTRIAA